MIVDIVHVQRVAFGKAKNNSPVGSNSNGPKAFQLTLQGVKAEAGQVHIRRRSGCIETRKNVAQLFRVLADYPARVVVFIQTSQAFVADRAN